MKLLSTLSLIFLIAASIQAAPTMEDTEEEEQNVPAGQLSFTPSNCTLDDLLEELGQDLETVTEGVRSKRDVCTPVGPYGGSGGGAFIELPDNCNAFVSKIVIRSATYINAIQLTYQYSDGLQYISGYHGGIEGSSHQLTLDVSGGERVIGIFGRTAAYVDQLGFITNKGRIFGPFGGCGGGPFTVNSCNIKGLHGRSGGLIDSIGFFCGSI